MSYQDYVAYLTSPAVASQTRGALRAGWLACNTEQRLEVHHRTYEHLFYENVETDLTTLCQRCHKAVHTAMARGKPRRRKTR